MKLKAITTNDLHEQGIRSGLAALVALALIFCTMPAFAQTATNDSPTSGRTATAIPEVMMIRHAPSIAGTVTGSIRQLLPEYLSLGGSSIVSGDVMVPGTPRVRLTGSAVYAGTIDEGGAMLPNNYMVALGGQARLRHIIRCVDPKPMPSVDAPEAPAGTETIVLSTPEQCVRHWDTVRNLTVTGQALACAVPSGVYGNFRAEAGTGLILGVAGSSWPTHYSFESLEISGQASLQIVGPVVITIVRGMTLSGSAGSANNPSWLKLQICQGDLTLNAGSSLNANVLAPRSSVYVNGNAMLTGYLAADRLWIGAGGVVSNVMTAPGSDEPSQIFGYQSAWRYKVFAITEEAPDGWEENDFRATGWTNGRGSFASGGYCEMQGMRMTDWPVSSQIIIRKNFRLSSNVTSLRISGTVAGDVQIYLNGRLVTDWVTHEGCPQSDDLSFTAPANSYWPGLNTIAIRARSTGDQSFLDYRVSINE